MALEYRDNPTFTCNEGLFFFTLMLFRLKNTRGTFQRVIDIILSSARWK